MRKKIDDKLTAQEAANLLSAVHNRIADDGHQMIGAVFLDGGDAMHMAAVINGKDKMLAQLAAQGIRQLLNDKSAGDFFKYAISLAVADGLIRGVVIDNDDLAAFLSKKEDEPKSKKAVH